MQKQREPLCRAADSKAQDNESSDSLHPVCQLESCHRGHRRTRRALKLLLLLLGVVSLLVQAGVASALPCWVLHGKPSANPGPCIKNHI